MKLLSGVCISVALLLAEEKPARPDAFFEPGSKVVYSNFSVVSKQSERYTSVVTVESVSRKTNSVSSICSMRYYDDKKKMMAEYKVGYAMDSLNFYVSTTNWLMESLNPPDSYYFSRGDSLWYPLKMKVGDTLRSAKAYQDFDINGVRGTTNTTLTKRNVVSADTLNLGFGQIPAFKISMIIRTTGNTKDTYTGTTNTTVEYEIIEWFSPTYGIVKSQYETEGYRNLSIMTRD